MLSQRSTWTKIIVHPVCFQAWYYQRSLDWQIDKTNRPHVPRSVDTCRHIGCHRLRHLFRTVGLNVIQIFFFFLIILNHTVCFFFFSYFEFYKYFAGICVQDSIFSAPSKKANANELKQTDDRNFNYKNKTTIWT